MPAYYDCKRCDQSHRVPTEFPTRLSLRNSDFSRDSFPCPKTEKRALYTKDELFWREEDSREENLEVT